MNRRWLRSPSTPVPCAWVRERLAGRVLGVFSRRETLAVDAHLRRCAGCRARAARERELVSMLPRGLEPCEPPPVVLERVLERIRAGRRYEWGRRSIPTFGMLASALVLALAVLVFVPGRAQPSLAKALESPDVAVISLFASLDSPISSHYAFRTVSDMRFDQSVGRILFNVVSGNWQLVVHGLPRPPRGARYVLTAQVDGRSVKLGTIRRWESGVAVLAGRSPLDLTRTERLSVELVAPKGEVRLLDASAGAW